MKNLIFLFSLLLILLSCSDKNGYEITGTIPANTGKEKIYLLKNNLKERTYTILDSTIVENNTFKFKGKITNNEPEIYFLSFDTPDKAEQIYSLILEKGKINVVFSYDKEYLFVTGTPINDEWNEVQKAYMEKISSMNELYESERLSAEQIRQFKTLRKDISNLLYNFIKPRINNNIGEYYFLSFRSRLEEQHAEELLAMSNPEFRKLKQIQDLQTKLKTEKSTRPGNAFTDVSGITPDGKEVKLSDLIGKDKIVLLDFWASWCIPCIEDIPNVKTAYEKYKDKGFQVVGISLDHDKEAWKKAIERLNLPWAQISDLKGWESEFVQNYPARPIPFTVLLDRDGKIIEKRLRGNMLLATLEELFQVKQ